MADTKISADYVANPFTWSGTEILAGIKSGANGAGLVSALQTYFATLKTAQNEAATVTIASSGSVSIGAAAANTINVTGTNTITAFDTIAAGAKRLLVFAGILTLTQNGTSLILPSAANITTAAGDAAEMISLGSGNWKCVQYTRANGTAIIGSSFTGGTLSSALNEAPQVTIASATTTDVGAATANSVSISGTTTITGLGTIAAGALRRLTFQGIVALTHNGTSLILPGAANITTAAGDVFSFESLGSGNWRCIGYQRATPGPLAQVVTSSATVTPTFANDLIKITAQAAGLTLANPTGTAVEGFGMAIRIKDNGTARSISYGTQYRALGVTLPTTTVISKTLYLAMVFNSDDTKWDVVAVAQEA